MQQLPTILPPPTHTDGSETSPRSAEKHANLVRFQSELEFVQCLASPQYLHELSIQGYLSKPSFLNYLKYLEYWRSPEYVKFIVYPTCLVYLTLVQTELFRSRLPDPGFVAELMRIGTKHHETWRVEKAPLPLTLNQGRADVKLTSGADGRAGQEDAADDDEAENEEGAEGDEQAINGSGKKKKRKSLSVRTGGQGSRDGIE